MGIRTLYRKAQKKAKRKKYARCSACRGWATCVLVGLVPTKTCHECGLVDERKLTGSIGRQIDALPKQ